MLTKHINLISIILFTLCLTSCQKELSFENSNSSNGNGSSSDCKGCNYFPLCKGSTYNYSDTILGVVSERNAVYDIIKDTTIAGKTFVKYTTGDGSFAYYNCSNGESRNIVYNAIGMQNTLADKIDLIMIKENAPVGASWIDVVTNQMNQEIEYRDTIMEKGISKTVIDKNFADVIHVKTISGVVLPQPIGFFPFTQSDYYFAKNVGLVDAVTTDINSATVIQHTVLKSYSIP